MTAPAQPSLTPGSVYRTRDLRAWSSNPTRLAERLVREGRLVRLAQGLYAHPKRGRFGEVPPDDDTLMTAFLEGAPYVFTGPAQWNALGVGATAMHAVPLVYNTKRTAVVDLRGRKFRLRRVAFPVRPAREWFAIDLIEHRAEAGVALETLQERLSQAVAAGELDGRVLLEMARRYGTAATQRLVSATVCAERR